MNINMKVWLWGWLRLYKMMNMRRCLRFY